MSGTIRLNRKKSANFFDFLVQNEKDFTIERTATGIPTFVVEEKRYYISDKPMMKGTLNKISTFQGKTAHSELFEFVSEGTPTLINEEADIIRNGIIYKGFDIPEETKQIRNCVRVDLNSAYWQTCKLMGLIEPEYYQKINDNCVKGTRLQLVGTLGRSVRVTEYKAGCKIRTYYKGTNKRRAVFLNIYERIKKYVDETMMMVRRYDPENFLGYYVDCFWLREPDEELLKHIRKVFNLKAGIADLKFTKNKHHSYYMSEKITEGKGKGEFKPYDVQFRGEQFDDYNFLHNFDNANLKPDFLVRWKNK